MGDLGVNVCPLYRTRDVSGVSIQPRREGGVTYQAKEDDPGRGEEEGEKGGDELRGNLLLRAESVEDLGKGVEGRLVGVLSWQVRGGNNEVKELELQRGVNK